MSVSTEEMLRNIQVDGQAAEPAQPQPEGGGIVRSAADATPAQTDPTQYQAREIQPVTSPVREDVGTVEGRLNRLTEGGGRYIQQAERGAIRSAAGRGLINTSIAAGAGREAAIAAALPIAQQDASIYERERLENQAVRNRFLENIQTTELNREMAGFQSRLSRGEQAQLTNLQMMRDRGLSELTREEQTLLTDLEMRRDAAQSGLSMTENEQLNTLQMRRDEGISELTMAEQTQLSDLQIRRDAALSGLSIIEQERLNELQMQRDEGISALTMAEQTQLAELESIRDTRLSQLGREDAEFMAALDMQSDAHSAELNGTLARLQSTLAISEQAEAIRLKEQADLVLQNQRLSDAVKLEYVNSANTIIRDTQQQILDIGLSDRTAEQQATVIELAKDSRDAQLAVYGDLLNSFNDWDWGTGFAPERVAPAPAATAETGAGAVATTTPETETGFVNPYRYNE